MYRRTEIDNLDPYDENLTPEEKSIILEKCANDYGYFLKKLVRAPEYIIDVATRVTKIPKK